MTANENSSEKREQTQSKKKPRYCKPTVEKLDTKLVTAATYCYDPGCDGLSAVLV